MSHKLALEAKRFSCSLFWFGLGFFPALPDSLGEIQIVGMGEGSLVLQTPCGNDGNRESGVT